MNTTIESILQHRSIRRFSDRHIEADEFKKIVLAGQAASTSSFIQATSVIQVNKPELRKRLVSLAGDQKYIGSAAEFLVLCTDLNRNHQRVVTENPEVDYSWAEQFLAASIDTALFAQNMVIAAESLGLGCCYIGGIRNNPDEVSDCLQLPRLVYPLFGLCIGYPEQHPDLKPRLPLEVVLHQNKYQYSDKESQLVDVYDQEVSDYYSQRTGGKLEMTWSKQMLKQSNTQTRPFIDKSIKDKGLSLK